MPLIKDDFEGKIQCIPPNSLLYNFDGVMYWNDTKISLNHKHLVLRGSRLKNVKWVIGIVVYTVITFLFKTKKNREKTPR